MRDEGNTQAEALSSETGTVREELDRLLFLQARATILMGALVSCIAAATLHGAVDSRTLFGWLVFGLVSQLIRVPLLLDRARRSGKRPSVTVYAGCVGLSGCAWGSLSVLFWSPTLSMVNQIVIVLFPMALSIAAVTSYCSSPRTYFAFILPAQLPFVFITLSSGDTSIVRLAAPALLFLGGQLLLFRRFHAQIAASIRLQSRNQSLVEDLSRQNEALLEARDEAEVASRAKSEFLTRVSHEFRTPINGVLGPLQLLDGSDLDTRQRHLMSTVRESGDRLLRMVDNVIEVSSLDASTPGSSQVDYSVQSLIWELMARWESIALDKGLSMEWSVDARLPQAILGDDRAVQRVLEHLLGNAIEYTDTGGITVHATLDTSVSDQPQLRISVSDTGVGIAPGQTDQIFDDFVQGSDSMTRASSGTGLGLSIVRRLTSSMGGSVSVTSDPGIGSTFLVLLPMQAGSADKLLKSVPSGTKAGARPLDEASTASSEAARAEGLQSQPIDETDVPRTRALRTGLKALVAEDNRVNQMVIEAMLDNLGCEVYMAENGAVALEAFETQAFDIVFMDCQMPVMDGYKAASAIRERGGSVPIVAVTANALVSDRERCFRVGMNDFLSKPFASDSLEKMLVRWAGAGDGTASEAIA